MISLFEGARVRASASAPEEVESERRRNVVRGEEGRVLERRRVAYGLADRRMCVARSDDRVPELGCGGAILIRGDPDGSVVPRRLRERAHAGLTGRTASRGPP